MADEKAKPEEKKAPKAPKAEGEAAPKAEGAAAEGAAVALERVARHMRIAQRIGDHAVGLVGAGFVAQPFHQLDVAGLLKPVGRGQFGKAGFGPAGLDVLAC